MKRNGKKKVAVVAVISAMALSLTGCSDAVRMIKDNDVSVNETESNQEENVSIEMLKDSKVIGEDTNDKLEDIEELIGENFYFEEDAEKKQEGIIRGYMDSLGDPYSVYYSAEEFADFMEDSEGEYVGIGVQVSQNIDTNVITVTKVFDGPAKEAGIYAEDIITEVNGEDISTQDIDTVVDKIKGEEGTEVTVTVYRSADGKEYEFTMPRRKVENPTVESEMLDNGIGYIAIHSFYDVTDDQFLEAVVNLEASGMEGLIVDLRDNGGGLLDVAVNMLDYMLPEGKIVYTEDKDGNVTSQYTSSADEQFEKPLVVMVNGYSASASEIFAGAIKDYGIGTILGETTYGKGIVQRMFPLEDGSAIKLTIAKYFTPNGNDIHQIGIEPDVEVELDYDAYRESDGEDDNQLQAAIDCLMEKMGKSTGDTASSADTTEE